MQWLLAVVALAVSLLVHPAATAAQCPGDLNGDGTVTVNEIITAVSALLNGCTVDACPGDLNADGTVTVDEIVKAVTAALDGCDGTPSSTATATATAPPTPTPTAPVESCPYTFQDDTLSLGVSCGYTGPFSDNATCSQDLSALLLSDGHLVAISVGSDPLITFGGVASSATEATLLAYFVGSDLTPQPLSGTIQLTDAGKTLVIAPSTVPTFNIGADGCTFDRYTGMFAGTFSGQAQSLLRRLAGRP